jgi:hypothetical protein
LFSFITTHVLIIFLVELWNVISRKILKIKFPAGSALLRCTRLLSIFIFLKLCAVKKNLNFQARRPVFLTERSFKNKIILEYLFLLPNRKFNNLKLLF